MLEQVWREVCIRSWFIRENFLYAIKKRKWHGVLPTDIDPNEHLLTSLLCNLMNNDANLQEFRTSVVLPMTLILKSSIIQPKYWIARSTGSNSRTTLDSPSWLLNVNTLVMSFLWQLWWKRSICRVQIQTDAF